MDDTLTLKITDLFSSLSQELRLLDAQGDSLIPKDSASYYLPDAMIAGEIREHNAYHFMRLNTPDSLNLMFPFSEYSADILRLAASAIDAIAELYPHSRGQTDAYRRLLTEDIEEEEVTLLVDEHRIPQNLIRCVILIKLHSVKQQAYELLQSLTPLEDPDVLLPFETDKVILIKALEDTHSLTEAKEFAQALEETVREESSFSISCGIGDIQQTAPGLRESYFQAQQALDIGPKFFLKENIFVWHDMILPRFLSEIPTDRAKYYHSLVFNKKTSRLLTDEMLQTVEMFLEKDLNMSETSRHLYIHRNTLVYRLDKMQRLVGLDLRKFSDAFLFKLLYDLKFKLTDKNKRNQDR